MLYVIYGTDTQKTRHKLTELLDVLQKKRPDAPITRIKPENWSEGFFNETISSAGLFAPKNIIILDSLISSPASSESVLSQVDDLEKSEHVCILIEEKIKAADLKKIEKKSEKVQEFSLEKNEQGEDSLDAGNKKPNLRFAQKSQFPKTFTFADAVAMRDKKKSWSIFQELTKDSLSPEEIHGVLWWQFKSIVLAGLCSNAKDAGLNPFVYSKCKNFSNAWKGKELRVMLKKLACMYHDAHRGEIDFMSELEVLCL